MPDDSWTIKSATVSQESDGKYYISVLFEFENIVNPYVADKTNAIGLDYASDGLYVDSVRVTTSLLRLSVSYHVCKALRNTRLSPIII